MSLLAYFLHTSSQLEKRWSIYWEYDCRNPRIRPNKLKQPNDDTSNEISSIKGIVTYRNIFKFSPWRLFRCSGGYVFLPAVNLVTIVVVALSNWRPLEKEEVGTVCTVSSSSLRVIVGGIRWWYVYPFLLPFPYWTTKNGGGSITSWRTAESGPNSLHSPAERGGPAVDILMPELMVIRSTKW